MAWGMGVGGAQGGANLGNMYEVVKVINWDGSSVKPRSSFANAVVGEGMLKNLAFPLSQKVGLQMVVKFDVSSASSYEFVSQCSGRGLCNGDSGLCECFTGYTNDNCDQQSALAV